MAVDITRRGAMTSRSWGRRTRAHSAGPIAVLEPASVLAFPTERVNRPMDRRIETIAQRLAERIEAILSNPSTETERALVGKVKRKAQSG